MSNFNVQLQNEEIEVHIGLFPTDMDFRNLSSLVSIQFLSHSYEENQEFNKKAEENLGCTDW